MKLIGGASALLAVALVSGCGGGARGPESTANTKAAASASPTYDASSATYQEKWTQFQVLAKAAGIPRANWPLDNSGDSEATADVICGDSTDQNRYARDEKAIYTGSDYAPTKSGDLIFADAYCPELRPMLVRAFSSAERPKPHTVGRGDFVVKLKIRAKQCFGSAGCNVTYQINPLYKRDVSELKGRSFDVTYKVTGGEDGPQINTFSLAGTELSYDKEEFISTPSAGTVLKAKVIRVDRS